MICQMKMMLSTGMIFVHAGKLLLLCVNCRSQRKENIVMTHRANKNGKYFSSVSVFPQQFLYKQKMSQHKVLYLFNV